MRILIVDEAELAALLARSHSVQADVELGAVRGVGVLGVRVGDAERVLGSDFRTLESALVGLALCGRTLRGCAKS